MWPWRTWHPRAKQHQRATTIRTLLADGHLVPDDIILELLVASLQGGRALGAWPGAPKFSDTDRQVLVLENFPATEQQASLWDEARPRLPKISHVFLLDCPEDEMLTRVLERGKAAESSDGAGKRRDDNEDAWANRMRKWKHCKETVVAARQAAGTCFEVDSMRPIGECAAAGIAKLEELCGQPLARQIARQPKAEDICYHCMLISRVLSTARVSTPKKS